MITVFAAPVVVSTMMVVIYVMVLIDGCYCCRSGDSASDGVFIVAAVRVVIVLSW